MLRDRLKSHIAAMGQDVDYVRLAHDVLGVRNAPAPLARKLVEQALVVGDRREEWARAGRHICADAPEAPGVYILRDAEGAVLYVGKAVNLKRRMRSHFAPRRWLMLDPDMARAVSAEWTLVGSELEALLFEAEWIATLAPKANVQTGLPSMKGRRVPQAIRQDVVLVLQASDPDYVTLVAARVDGPVSVIRTRRDATELSRDVPRVWRFLMGRLTGGRTSQTMQNLAPLVYSWLTGRGESATRFDGKELESPADLRTRLERAFASGDLFRDRLIIRSV
jgi:hypothetical protein